MLLHACLPVTLENGTTMQSAQLHVSQEASAWHALSLPICRVALGRVRLFTESTLKNEETKRLSNLSKDTQMDT